MNPELLIAQVSHGPGMHGGLLVTGLVAVALVIGVVVALRKRRNDARTGSENESDRGPEL